MPICHTMMRCLPEAKNPPSIYSSATTSRQATSVVPLQSPSNQPIAITHTYMTIPQKIPLRGPLREHDSPHLSRCQHPCPRNTFHPFTPPAPSVSPNKIRPLDNRKTKKMIKNLHGSRKSRTFASAIIKIVIFTK